MPTSKQFTSILLCSLVAASFGLTACKKGGSKGKSERLRWVKKPTNGSAEEGGKIFHIPGLAVDFYTPDVLYVYKNCEEAPHSPEGPESTWVPVIRCTSPFASSSDSDDDWESSDDDSASGGDRELTIFVAEKGATIINERTTTSMRTEFEQQGFEVESINYFDEYLAKPGRRGVEIIAHTIDSSSGYPDRELRRFMFPKDDVLFIAHIDYEYGADRSGINSDWERILWNFQFQEDGALFQ